MLNYFAHYLNTATRHFAGLRLGEYAAYGLLLACLFAPVGVQAQSPVWHVSNGESHIYLAGTVHLLRISDYPLPAQFEAAYADADKLYFEVDITELMNPATQARMMPQLTYQDGTTLRTLLNDEAWDALSDYAEQVNLPLPMVQTFRPGLLVSTLSMLEFQRRGFQLQGVDQYFYLRAAQDGKPTAALESVQSQFTLVAELGKGSESEFVLYSLRDMERAGDSIERLVTVWREGDIEAMEHLFLADMREEVPEIYDAMLVARNKAWMDVILGLFDSGHTELVLAGAAHMAGEHGLLQLLRDKGFTVRQL